VPPSTPIRSSPRIRNSRLGPTTFHRFVFATALKAVAVFASTTNIVTEFLITDRVLRMFKKQEPGKG
jgi:NAD/NADP transhydrogenase alpha subunit